MAARRRVHPTAFPPTPGGRVTGPVPVVPAPPPNTVSVAARFKLLAVTSVRDVRAAVMRRRIGGDTADDTHAEEFTEDWSRALKILSEIGNREKRPLERDVPTHHDEHGRLRVTPVPLTFKDDKRPMATGRLERFEACFKSGPISWTEFGEIEEKVKLENKPELDIAIGILSSERNTLEEAEFRRRASASRSSIEAVVMNGTNSPYSRKYDVRERGRYPGKNALDARIVEYSAEFERRRARAGGKAPARMEIWGDYLLQMIK